jgi:hypothetical protein
MRDETAWTTEEWAGRRRQVWRARRRAFLEVILLAAALGLLAGVVYSEAFRCRVIYLAGPRPDLLARVKPLLEDLGTVSTACCRRGQIAARAGMCLAVARVSIRSLSRHELEVYVEPRSPAALLSSPSQPRAWMLADRGGMVYESVRAAPPGLVRLVALPTQALCVGHRLPADALALYGQVLDGVAQSGVPYTKVDFTHKDRASAVAYLGDGTPVKIGALDNMRRKLALAGWVWRGARNKGLAPAYVDVRVPSRPAFLPVGAVEAATVQAAAPPSPQAQ